MKTEREVLLGWRNSSPQAALAFFPPEPLNQTEAAGLSTLFPEHTPGSDLASRIFVIRCPFNIRTRVGRMPNGQIGFQRIAEPGSITENAFRGLVTPIEPTAQRAKDTPTCQISMNLVMISDEPCSMQLMPPFLSPGFRDWPGSLVCGRFPLQNWPRPLNAALEWHDKKRDWILKRGDPLAYVMAIYDDPCVRPKIVEAGMTPALKRHLLRIDDVSTYGRNVGPMFIAAEQARPARLLVPKDKAKTSE
jgi:hypothetical protein